MKENKCFFSVRLENGIVITGKNPYEVYDYLRKMQSAFIELWNHYLNKGLPKLQEEAMQEQMNINNAINTIENNLNK